MLSPRDLSFVDRSFVPTHYLHRLGCFRSKRKMDYLLSGFRYLGRFLRPVAYSYPLLHCLGCFLHRRCCLHYLFLTGLWMTGCPLGSLFLAWCLPLFLASQCFRKHWRCRSLAPVVWPLCLGTGLFCLQKLLGQKKLR